MAKHHYSNQMSNSYHRQNLQKDDMFGKALTDITSSDRPGKWIAGVGLAAMAVAGIAIKAICDMENRR